MTWRGPVDASVANGFAGLHDGTLATLTVPGEYRSVMRG